MDAIDRFFERQRNLVFWVFAIGPYCEVEINAMPYIGIIAVPGIDY